MEDPADPKETTFSIIANRLVARTVKKQTQRNRRDLRNRTGFVLIGASALGFAILLGAVKFPVISVAARLATDEVRFKFKEPWSINDVSAQSVSVVNAADVNIDGELWDEDMLNGPYPVALEGRIHPKSATSLSMSLTPNTSKSRVAVNLAISAESDVIFSLQGNKPRTLAIKIAGHATEGSVDAGKEFSIVCTSCQIGQATVDDRASSHFAVKNSKREVRFIGSAEPLLVNIKLAEQDRVTNLSLGEPLQVEGVDLQRGDLPLYLAVFRGWLYRVSGLAPGADFCSCRRFCQNSSRRCSVGSTHLCRRYCSVGVRRVRSRCPVRPAGGHSLTNAERFAVFLR